MRAQRLLLVLSLALGLVLTTGCTRFQRYVGSFGAVGTAAGGVVGATTSASVNAGEGMLMGAAGGGLVGAVVADQFDDTDWEGMERELARLKSENDDAQLALAAKDKLLGERDSMLASALADLDAANGRDDALRAELAALRDQIGARDRDMARLADDLKVREAALSDMEGELEALQERLGSEVTVAEDSRGGITLTILDELLFRSGSAQLSKDGERVLSSVSDTIAAFYPERELIVEGHTDNVPIAKSGWKSNWELGAGRALSVLHYLNHNEGIPGSRLSAMTFADTHPAAPNDTPSGRTLNRRAVIVILPPTEPMRVPHNGQIATASTAVVAMAPVTPE